MSFQSTTGEAVGEIVSDIIGSWWENRKYTVFDTLPGGRKRMYAAWATGRNLIPANALAVTYALVLVMQHST
jgi:hypothetical protein